jgi:hypothetical protein
MKATHDAVCIQVHCTQCNVTVRRDQYETHAGKRHTKHVPLCHLCGTEFDPYHPEAHVVACTHTKFACPDCGVKDGFNVTSIAVDHINEEGDSKPHPMLRALHHLQPPTIKVSVSAPLVYTRAERYDQMAQALDDEDAIGGADQPAGGGADNDTDSDEGDGGGGLIHYEGGGAAPVGYNDPMSPAYAPTSPAYSPISPVAHAVAHTPTSPGGDRPDGGGGGGGVPPMPELPRGSPPKPQ